MKKLVVVIAWLALCVGAARFRAEEDAGRRHGLGGRRQARSAHRVDDAGQGTAELDVQRPRPRPARQDQPRIHRARSGRELDVESGGHRMDVQASPRRPMPPRLRRVHRRRRRLLDQAREQQGDLVVLERFLGRRQGRGAGQVHGQDHAQESRRGLPGLRRQRQRRQPDLQEGRRGDGRELREEADRHRPVHVRRVPAAAIRQAHRQQAVLPRRAGDRGDHVSLHSRRFEPRSRVPVGRARHDLRQAGPDVDGSHGEASRASRWWRWSRASSRCCRSTSR